MNDSFAATVLAIKTSCVAVRWVGGGGEGGGYHLVLLEWT